MSPNAQQKTYWNEEVGDLWVRNQARLDQLMAPLTEALLQVAAPQPGERVLDIGCGCGELAIRLSESIGADGEVVALDISRPMLAAAEARDASGRRAGQAPVTWREADAMTETFETPFDLAISRFGVMFFEDRARAFANIRRAVRPGGRFAFVTWRGRRDIEWFERPLEWVAPILPTPDPSDGEIGPCALADGEATRGLLEEAGFRNVQAEPLDRRLRVGQDVEDAFDLLSRTGPAAGLMRAAAPAEREAAARLMRAGLASIATSEGIEMHGACWIYRGWV